MFTTFPQKHCLITPIFSVIKTNDFIQQTFYDSEKLVL